MRTTYLERWEEVWVRSAQVQIWCPQLWGDTDKDKVTHYSTCRLITISKCLAHWPGSDLTFSFPPSSHVLLISRGAATLSVAPTTLNTQTVQMVFGTHGALYQAHVAWVWGYTPYPTMLIGLSTQISLLTLSFPWHVSLSAAASS